MAKTSVIVAVAASLAFALTPAFMNANTAAAPAIIGSNCLVKVYHTNFNFPAEGGQIVQIGSEMFFWKNYLPHCANAVPGSAQTVSSSPPVQQIISNSLHGSYGSQLADSPCAVRVYHTNFNFPAEGGQIVKIGSELFFIRSYRPECAGAGQLGTVVLAANPLPASNTVTTPAQPVTAPVVQTNPVPVCY